MARPDVFSVRNTSVKKYLLPMVHKVKVSCADLLSNLRHATKRESYQWRRTAFWVRRRNDFSRDRTRD